MVADQTVLSRAGQRYLVFILAFVAGAESLAQAVGGFLDRRLDQMVLWLTTYLVIVVFAGFAERIKIGRAE